jgi:hypothetical protein
MKNPNDFNGRFFDLQIFKKIFLGESGNIKGLRAKKFGNRVFSAVLGGFAPWLRDREVRKTTVT